MDFLNSSKKRLELEKIIQEEGRKSQGLPNDFTNTLLSQEPKILQDKPPVINQHKRSRLPI